MAADEKQVLVKFVTKLPAELRVPETPVAVPATLKRYGLSQIINHMLGLDPARPFDFVISGELLRKSLEAHLLQHGLSAEALLEVEYIPAVVPPQLKQSAPHDDWVSSVDGSWKGHLISGSYDGCVRVWDTAGEQLECSRSWHAHTGGVNAVASCAPSTSGSGSGSRLVVTAGKDQAVYLWQVAKGDGSPQLLASYTGHTDAVEGVAVSPDGTHLASCGWDGSLNLWRAGHAVEEAAAEAQAAKGGAAKRRKAGAAEAAPGPGSALVTEEAVSQLQGHLHCVSSVSFGTNGTLFSGGWDHSVRRWDISTGANTDTYNGSKVVCAVACPPGGGTAASAAGSAGSLVAFGCSDRVLRVWDSRARSGEAMAVKGYPAHAGWVVGVAWCPSSPFHLATASHDHTVKVWDMRSAVPLATLSEHGDKALCVAWAGPSTIASGGADSKLLTYELEQPLVR